MQVNMTQGNKRVLCILWQQNYYRIQLRCFAQPEVDELLNMIFSQDEVAGIFAGKFTAGLFIIK